jgi:hypothetical protein
MCAWANIRTANDDLCAHSNRDATYSRWILNLS